jgi:hypothetical protein
MADEDSGGTDDKIPAGVQERISKLTAARREAEARASQLEERIAELAPAAKKLETLSTQLAEYQRREQAWTEERTILSSGISDPDGVDFARHAWSRLPDDKRPAGGIAEWLTQRDALPKAVQAYLPPAAAGSTQQAASTTQQTSGANGQQAAAAKLPASNTGAAPQVPHGQVAWTPERIRALTPAEYAANKDAIKAELMRR